MPYQYAIYEKKARVAYVTINRPEVMNALHPPAILELSEIWRDFRDDPELWVGIVTGAGDRAFSAGMDLKYSAIHESERQPEHDSTSRKEGRLPDIYGELGGFGGLTSLFDCWKPIIAAVNGYALGGGLDMVLACDIAVAAEHARFGLTEATMGRVPSLAGGVHRLPRQIPLKIAMGMILTGRHITAQEAYRVGLVNEVVPLKDLMPAAKRWAEEILQCAPLAVQGCKQASMRGLDMPLETAMRVNYPAVTVAEGSEDWQEGPKAFAEKRKPVWKGR